LRSSADIVNHDCQNASIHPCRKFLARSIVLQSLQDPRLASGVAKNDPVGSLATLICWPQRSRLAASELISAGSCGGESIATGKNRSRGTLGV
jgi:hypothetical protein